MRLKIIFPLLLMLVLCIQMQEVHAAQGSIRIALPEDIEEQTVTCISESGTEEVVTFQTGTPVVFYNLQPGTYHISVKDTERYEFSESKITLPMWDEEEHKMVYEVEIKPKYNRKEVAPVTGDTQKGLKYIIIGGISLIFVLIMSCHNRSGCAKMSRKYSKKRRT